MVSITTRCSYSLVLIKARLTLFGFWIGFYLFDIHFYRFFLSCNFCCELLTLTGREDLSCKLLMPQSVKWRIASLWEPWTVIHTQTKIITLLNKLIEHVGLPKFNKRNWSIIKLQHIPVMNILKLSFSGV